MFNLDQVDKKLAGKLMLIHVAIIALSNYIVSFPLEVFGIKLTWAMLTFPLIIVATDLTIRLTNKYQARYVIALAYIPAIIVSTLITDWRIGLASATAYLIGQLFDVTVFQRIREKISLWWAAPLTAAIFSNIVDTYVFFATAFAGNTNVPYMAENWFAIATSDVVFKIIVSVLIILPTYGVLLNYLLKRVKTS